jgi:carbon storage regulator
MHEKLLLDGDITIQVVDIRGDKVRLGITAPKEIGIYREEVQLRIVAEHEQQVEAGE